MSKTFTNIKELEAHLNNKFKGMMKSKEMANAGKLASKTMGRHVGDELIGGGSSGYDYDQSGDFKKLIAGEAKHGQIHQTPSKLSMGFGYLPEMNEGVEARRNFQLQDHIVKMNGSRIQSIRTFKLEQENQMPKWILAEFGSGNKGDKSARPNEFDISYTPRPQKDMMYGPSLGNVRGEGGGRKKGYFMLTGKNLMNLLGRRAENKRNFKKHPGLKAGRIFRKGLESSKKEVRDILGDGIRDYLNNN